MSLFGGMRRSGPLHYDCRPDLKALYTAIVRTRDEGELSLAAAQLNGVLGG